MSDLSESVSIATCSIDIVYADGRSLAPTGSVKSGPGPMEPPSTITFSSVELARRENTVWLEPSAVAVESPGPRTVSEIAPSSELLLMSETVAVPGRSPLPVAASPHPARQASSAAAVITENRLMVAYFANRHADHRYRARHCDCLAYRGKPSAPPTMRQRRRVRRGRRRPL